MRRLLPLAAGLLLACAPDSTEAGADVVRTTAGDTTVVRTVRGAVWPDGATWRSTLSIGTLDGPEETSFGRLRSIAVTGDGRILAVDGQVPVVRVFGADGTYLDSWGRRGQGPGELERPDAGLVVLPDGRVVVRDPGNARLQVFGPDGRPRATWPVITGQYINRRAFGLAGDTLVQPDVVNPMDPLPEWRLGLVRIDSDGEVLDTLALPEERVRPHRFVARAGGNMAEADLPFAPAAHWSWHPDGHVVHGTGDRYAVTLDRATGPLRIEREVTPTPVSAGEKAQEEARVFAAMRWLDPGWRWDGPPIPDTKPHFSGLLTGEDGRVWVLRDGPAFGVEDPEYDPTDPDDVEIRWRQERLMDAFERDGTFLGSVTMPRTLDDRVPPVLRGDTLWAVTRDDLGVQRIERFELTFGTGA